MNKLKKYLLEDRRRFGTEVLHYFRIITSCQNSMEGLRYNTKALANNMARYIKTKEHYRALVRIENFIISNNRYWG